MRKAILAALVALLISGSPAHAQKFPSHPITRTLDRHAPIDYAKL
jgi:hypothetical protein